MSAQLIDFPTASVQSSFEDAWSLLPSSMKTRSLSRAKLKPIWDRHAKQAGGQDVLLGALRAYLKGDKDLPKSGGPGLQVWLNNGKYDHWIESGNSVVADVSQDDEIGFPDRAIRDHCIKALGLAWVKSYLDPCEMVPGPHGPLIVPKTGYARTKLEEQKHILKAAGLYGMRAKA